MVVQWNLFNTDSKGPELSVSITEVSVLWRYSHVHCVEKIYYNSSGFSAGQEKNPGLIAQGK